MGDNSPRVLARAPGRSEKVGAWKEQGHWGWGGGGQVRSWGQGEVGDGRSCSSREGSGGAPGR